MTTSTIRITYGSDTVTLTCDLDEASAPLEVDGSPIGYRTADARHRRPLAVALAARYAWPDADWPGPWGRAGKHGLDFEGQDCDVCRHDAGGPCDRLCRPCWRDRGGCYPAW